jgi:hypothetical protein
LKELFEQNLVSNLKDNFFLSEYLLYFKETSWSFQINSYEKDKFLKSFSEGEKRKKNLILKERYSMNQPCLIKIVMPSRRRETVKFSLMNLHSAENQKFDSSLASNKT